MPDGAMVTDGRQGQDQEVKSLSRRRMFACAARSCAFAHAVLQDADSAMAQNLQSLCIAGSVSTSEGDLADVVHTSEGIGTLDSLRNSVLGFDPSSHQFPPFRVHNIKPMRLIIDLPCRPRRSSLSPKRDVPSARSVRFRRLCTRNP